jgi:hypothetical protein
MDIRLTMLSVAAELVNWKEFGRCPLLDAMFCLEGVRKTTNSTNGMGPEFEPLTTKMQQKCE